MNKLRTIILAAGKGTRLKSNTPKVLHKVAGQPIIQYVLDVASSVRSLKTCVIVGHKKQLVSEALSSDIDVVEQKPLLGTGHAVLCAGKFLKNYDGDVLILSGDTPLLDKAIIRKLVAKHRKSKAQCTFLTSIVDNPKGYGRIVRDQKGVLEAIREEKDATAVEKQICEMNVGVYCFKAKRLIEILKNLKINPKKKEYYLTDTIEILLSQSQKVETLVTQDESSYLGVNTRQDLAIANDIMRLRILDRIMDQGVTIVDPSTTFIENGVKINRDTIIYPFSYIHSNVKIGSNCSIGPFARVRPGSNIKDRTDIGNFTEVSRSQIGPDSMMKHFSFLGDAVVSSNVNIGAGFITANYDGTSKSKTQIESGSFIGSGSVIVAPVKVGAKSVVGAGSVVTKNTKIPQQSVVRGVPAKVFAKRKTK